ncbi:MAG TPA: hypothetical protein VGC61_02805 [Pyrinomonadaceae bacterium]
MKINLWKVSTVAAVLLFSSNYATAQNQRFKEASPNLELINDYFVTDWAGQYVLINFSSPTAKYEGYKSAVERSARSVQFGLVAESIELNSKTRSTPTTN